MGSTHCNFSIVVTLGREKDERYGGGKYEGEYMEEVCSWTYNIVFLKKWRKFRSIYGKMLTSVKPGW